MNTQHTPGPWKVCLGPDLDGNLAAQVSNGENFVASCGTEKSTMPGGFDRCKANAQLIASAPDLLALLRRVPGVGCEIDSAADGQACMRSEITIEWLRQARATLAAQGGDV